MPAVIEVYPAASLWAWGLPHTSYKRNGESARAKRTEILDGLSEIIGIPDGEHKQAFIGSEHCLDALVAALTASEYACGNTFDPQEVPDDLLRIEGWIRVPSRALGGRVEDANGPDQSGE